MLGEVKLAFHTYSPPKAPNLLHSAQNGWNDDYPHLIIRYPYVLMIIHTFIPKYGYALGQTMIPLQKGIIYKSNKL